MTADPASTIARLVDTAPPLTASQLATLRAAGLTRGLVVPERVPEHLVTDAGSLDRLENDPGDGE